MSLALVTCTLLAGVFAFELRAGRGEITVKGFSERPIVSDVAIWSASVVVRSPDLAQGYEQILAARERVQAFLRERGVPDDAVSVAAVTTSIQYERNDKGQWTAEIDHYELHQAVEVETRDAPLVDRVSKTVTSLIREGIEVSSNSPRFYYTGLDALKVDLLGEAAGDARVRAERIASDGGSTLGSLRTARQGVFQITPAWSSEVSAGGMYDTGSVGKTVRAVLTATFALE